MKVYDSKEMVPENSLNSPIDMNAIMIGECRKDSKIVGFGFQLYF